MPAKVRCDRRVHEAELLVELALRHVTSTAVREHVLCTTTERDEFHPGHGA